MKVFHLPNFLQVLLKMQQIGGAVKNMVPIWGGPIVRIHILLKYNSTGENLKFTSILWIWFEPILE